MGEKQLNNYALAHPSKLASLHSDREARIPALDGIRGMAVTIVFLAHAGATDYFPTIISGQIGPLSLTIFFFLSGYIITTLMRSELESTGALCFRNFYLRRLYRIFPPLYIVLFLAWAATTANLVPGSYTGSGLISQLIHFTNYYIALNGPGGVLPGTVLTWSLAVEEHFYLLFPLIFSVLITRMKYSSAAIFLCMLCLISLLWRCAIVFATDLPVMYTYYATDTRFDSLLYGCIMALWCNPALDKEIKASLLTKLIVTGLALSLLFISISTNVSAFEKTFMFTVQGLALLPLFYIAITNVSWPLFSWLEWPPVRGLGIISYTFYLSHGLALRLAQSMLGNDSFVRDLAAFALTAIFSTIMWYAIEKPLARARKRLHSPSKKMPAPA